MTEPGRGGWSFTRRRPVSRSCVRTRRPLSPTVRRSNIGLMGLSQSIWRVPSPVRRGGCASRFNGKQAAVLHHRPERELMLSGDSPRSSPCALLAYPHAAARQRAHRKSAGGNSENQDSEPAIFARRQEETRCSSGSRTSASEITANSGRTGFYH